MPDIDYNSFVGKTYCRKGEAKRGLVYTVNFFDEKTATFAFILNVNPDAKCKISAGLFAETFEPFTPVEKPKV
jgi:hypothetical protein